MNNHVVPKGVLICLWRYGYSFNLWVVHGSFTCKSIAVGTRSGLSLNTSGTILVSKDSTLVVSPLFICLVYNPGILIHRVAPDVGSSIGISVKKMD